MNLRLPGLIDVHVHLREPGGGHKENIASGTAAALTGGVTMLLAMPNTSPPVVGLEGLRLARRLVAEKALCDVGLFVGAAEDNAAQAAALAGETAGLKVYLDQTYGPLRMRSLAALLTHFAAWPATRPIAVHAEGFSVAVAIGLAQSFGRRLHLCHISRADEMALIRAAKVSGADVTCEVTPHHLFLAEADARRLGPFGSMKPPLATQADREALWAHLDMVDCIATDHAPHTRAEKEGAEPPPGVPGLETMLPLLLTAVAEGRLSMERLVELTYHGPRRVYGLPAQPETWVEVDMDNRYTVTPDLLHTQCGWNPFEGMDVQGRVRQVVLRGQTVFRDGQIMAAPGLGRVIVPTE